MAVGRTPLNKFPTPSGNMCVHPSSTYKLKNTLCDDPISLGVSQTFVCDQLCNVLVESRSFTLFSMIESLHEEGIQRGGKPEMLSNELGQK